jgi:hypothetical protein
MCTFTLNSDPRVPGKSLEPEAPMIESNQINVEFAIELIRLPSHSNIAVSTRAMRNFFA